MEMVDNKFLTLMVYSSHDFTAYSHWPINVAVIKFLIILIMLHFMFVNLQLLCYHVAHFLHTSYSSAGVVTHLLLWLVMMLVTIQRNYLLPDAYLLATLLQDKMLLSLCTMLNISRKLTLACKKINCCQSKISQHIFACITQEQMTHIRYVPAVLSEITCQSLPPACACACHEPKLMSLSAG